MLAELIPSGEGNEKEEVAAEEWNWESAGACVSVFAANLSHGVIKLHIILWLCVLDHWVQHHKKAALSLRLVVQLLHTCFKGAGDNLSNQRCLPLTPLPPHLLDLPHFSSPEAKSCEDIQCSAGKKCLWDARMSRGRCSLCDETCPVSRTDEAVCASDNTTYPSECAMKQAACSMGVLLEVKHSGSCNCK